MKNATRVAAVSALVSLVSFPPVPVQAAGDGVYWHTDPGVETCSMVIDSSLTQAQWKKFTREAGALSTFKSLATAEPLGKMNFVVGIDYSVTPIDQRDPAWINTFTHPDETCPLGDQIRIPTLRARLGVSRAMDVSGYWTTAPRANYGLVGGEFKYAFLRESAKSPAAAVSVSFTTLTGVPDFNLSIYSVGLVASKRMTRATPYLGVRQSLAVGTETTGKVDLDRESVGLTHGFIGATIPIWRLGLTAEYNVAAVNTFAFMLGFGVGAKAP